MRQAASQRKAIEPRPMGRRARVKLAPGRDAGLGYWLVPLPTVDPQIVTRSALARDDYGPEFSYAHYAGVKRFGVVLGAVLGGAALAAGAQVPAVRKRIGARVPQGTGPSDARRAGSWFTVDFVGAGGGQRVHTRVSGGDPGYSETAKMLAESAMCLAYDDNPVTAGQVTTATAMGENLITRLTAAGISFATVEAGG
jgi:saccharopine dehydrogenase (NAD+, L-glutamate forming)